MENIDIYSNRLKSIEIAQKRTRTSFLVATVATVSFLTIGFNSTLSWNRVCDIRRMLRDDSSNKKTINKKVNNKLTNSKDGNNDSLITLNDNDDMVNSVKIIKRQFLNEWVDSRTLFISFFGLRISVDDLVPLSGLTFLILSIWTMLSLNTERRTITSLLKETKDSDIKDKSFVFLA